MLPPSTFALALATLVLVGAGCSGDGLATCDALAQLNAVEGQRGDLIAAESDAASADDPQLIGAAAEAREDAEAGRLAALDVLDDAAGRDAGLLGALSRLRADGIGRPSADAQATAAALVVVNETYASSCG